MDTAVGLSAGSERLMDAAVGLSARVLPGRDAPVSG
jgi:hypothetical protein